MTMPITVQSNVCDLFCWFRNIKTRKKFPIIIMFGVNPKTTVISIYKVLQYPVILESSHTLYNAPNDIHNARQILTCIEHSTIKRDKRSIYMYIDEHVAGVHRGRLLGVRPR